MTQALLYFAGGVLGLLFYAAVLQLFKITKLLEQIKDQHPKSLGSDVSRSLGSKKFDIKGGRK